MLSHRQQYRILITAAAFAIIGFAFFAGYAGMRSQPERHSTETQRIKPEQQAQTGGGRAQGTQEMRTPARTQENGQSDADKARDEASEFWSIFGRRLKITDSLLALFTFFLVAIGIWQGIQLKRTVDAVRDELNATHRPELIAREIAWGPNHDAVLTCLRIAIWICEITAELAFPNLKERKSLLEAWNP
jgi:hypothetical protein